MGFVLVLCTPGAPSYRIHRFDDMDSAIEGDNSKGFFKGERVSRHKAIDDAVSFWDEEGGFFTVTS